jgi:hypothetical protein
MRHRPSCRAIASVTLLGVVFVLGACNAAVGDASTGRGAGGGSSVAGSSGSPSGTGTNGSPTGSAPTGNPISTGTAGNPVGGAGGSGGPGTGAVAVSFHRLNKVEYNNTVRDLLGTPLTPADDFAEDELGSKPGASFDNLADNLGATPSVARISQYLTAAKILMNDVFDNAERKNRLLFCDATQGPACVDRILTTFAERAWRRPIGSQELVSIKSLVTVATDSGDDVVSGIKLAMTMVLTSPYFVYRIESGSSPDGKTRTVNGFELASRLSYFLWSTMPDDALFADAASHKLDTSDGLLAAADRVLADPRSQQFVSNFAGQWLYTRNLPDHDVNPALIAQYPQLADSMRRETELFFRDFLFGSQSMSELLTANYSYVDDLLAKHYGLTLMPGPFATKITLAAPERRGVLTQASILTVTSHSDQTSPVKRGKWILYNLLCTDIQLPPNFTPPPLMPRPPGGTLRTQLEEHAKVEPCKSCHTIMDPIGFALENYDAVGRYRTMDENGVAINSSGTWPDGTRFTGAVDMEKVITQDPRFASCLVKNLYSYAIGRSSTNADEPTLGAIADHAQKNGFTMKQVIKDIVSSEPFRTQHPTQEGAGP